MSALPSFEPLQSTPPRKSRALRQTTNSDRVGKTKPNHIRRSRVKLNPVYGYRRQGLEAVTKLVTYSALSIFGIVTLINSISNNWSQQGKLQHLETELKDAKLRADQVNREFSRSFDPRSQKSVMLDNSYKIASDRRQIVFINPHFDSSQGVIKPRSVSKNQ